jgi:Cys-tRNA(Pro)/Cys-tRNA(Cys) deacylase
LKGKIRNIAKPSSSYHEVRWEVFGQGVGKSKFLRVEPDHLAMTHDELRNNCWPRGSMSGKITPAVQALQQAQVGFQLLEYDYDPSADAIGLQAAQALGRDPSTVFKTLVIALDSGELICAIIPSDRQLDLKAIAAGAGAKKAELADPGEAERATGYVVGGISPLGQRKRLRTFVDAAGSALDEIVVNGGRRGLQLTLRPADLVRITSAAVLPVTR